MSPRPASSQREISPARSGRCVTNQRARSVNHGTCASSSGSSTSTASIGSNPTVERTRSGTGACPGTRSTS